VIGGAERPPPPPLELSTVAEPASRSTAAAVTPATLRSATSTATTHAAHVIPLTRSTESCSQVGGLALSISASRGGRVFGGSCRWPAKSAPSPKPRMTAAKMYTLKLIASSISA